MMHGAVPDAGDPRSPTSWWLKGVGRLARGSSLEQAQSVLAGVARATAQERPETHRGFSVRLSTFNGTDPEARGQIVPVAALLIGMTLTVLLIACANVAGLQLSRAAGREREMGIRLAIGATRGALVRQLLAESLVLAVLAGASGLLLAMWGAEGLMRFAEVPSPIDITPDWRLLVFTAGVSLAAAVAFGLAPALRSASRDVSPALRAEAGTASSPRASRLQRSLVVGELAVALVLIAAAGLLLRGLSQAWKVDVGFDYVDRIAVSMDLRLQNYEPARAAAFYTQAIEQVRG
jgi:predicted lysophospholipase L1 biosynthesis ABC-type transport system permease subunit